MKWIPKEITQMEEFISFPLAQLRDYVLKTRNEDITIPLHVFEERHVLMDDSIMSWSTIACFENEFPQNPDYQPYSAEIRTVKKYFLHAWNEVRMWDHGGHEKQVIYDPCSLEDIGLNANIQDHFVFAKDCLFSMNAMTAYFQYINTLTGLRKKKPRFFQLSKQKDKALHVFVSDQLFNYYYGNETIKHQSTKHFKHADLSMKTITCLTDTQKMHAAIANFNSWQEYLHHIQGQSFMDYEKTISGQMKKEQIEATKDPTIFSDHIQEILHELSYNKRLCELNHMDSDTIQQAAARSPKIRVALRKAQLHYIRQKKLAVYETCKTETFRKTLHQEIKQKAGNALKHLGFQISDFLNQMKQSINISPVQYRLALATCLVLLITGTLTIKKWVYHPDQQIIAPQIIQQLTRLYQTYFHHQEHAQKEKLEQMMKFPWEQPDDMLGFDASTTDPVQQSFARGLIDGRQAIMKRLIQDDQSIHAIDREIQKKLKTTQATEIFYQMGRWCILVQTICMGEIDVTPDFWLHNKQLLEFFVDKITVNDLLKDADKQIVFRKFKTIRMLFAKMSQTKSKKDLREMGNAFYFLIHHLSPLEL